MNKSAFVRLQTILLRKNFRFDIIINTLVKCSFENQAQLNSQVDWSVVFNMGIVVLRKIKLNNSLHPSGNKKAVIFS